MAQDSRAGVALRNAMADAGAALFNSGYIRIYNGTRPADPSVAISTQTLLAELRFGATAFGSSSTGTATANAITSDSSADATGTATWARLLKSDGTTALEDVEVGTSGANINLNTTSIVAAASVAITSLTFAAPQQGT